MHEHNKGIVLMIMTTVIFAAQDTITKYLVQYLPILQIVGLRFVAFLIFAAWWATRKCSLKAALTVHNPKLQVARGALLGLEILLFGYVIRHLGVGEMQSLFLAYPLILTALSPWLLGEDVGWRRWLAISVGFIGTLIIIAPGSLSFTVYSLLGVACAGMFALYGILTRIAGRTDSAEASLLYAGLMGALVTVPFLPVVWQPMPPGVLGWLLLLCVTGVTSHYLMIQALKLTPAVILQPFNYLVLPWAILLGWVFFGELIPLHKWFGIALVVGGGIFIALRQRRLKGV